MYQCSLTRNLEYLVASYAILLLLPVLMIPYTYAFADSRSSAHTSPTPVQATVFLDLHSLGEITAPSSFLMVQVGVVQRRWDLLIVQLYGTATVTSVGYRTMLQTLKVNADMYLNSGFSRKVPRRAQHVDQINEGHVSRMHSFMCWWYRLVNTVSWPLFAWLLYFGAVRREACAKAVKKNARGMNL
jgi:hypothetical protein